MSEQRPDIMHEDGYDFVYVDPAQPVPEPQATSRRSRWPAVAAASIVGVLWVVHPTLKQVAVAAAAIVGGIWVLITCVGRDRSKVVRK